MGARCWFSLDNRSKRLGYTPDYPQAGWVYGWPATSHWPMVSAVEGASAKQGIAAEPRGRARTRFRTTTVVFTQYVRLVLPLDGFVFWIKTDLVTESALLNAMQMNTAQMNATLNVVSAMPTFTVKGSFHYSTQQRQEESEVAAVNTVAFPPKRRSSNLTKSVQTSCGLANMAAISKATTRR